MESLLKVEGLSKNFGLKAGFLGRTKHWVKAVQDVHLEIAPGETLGLVGESGSGKSTLARLILRLIEPTGGRVHFDGVELTGLSHQEMTKHRAGIQMIFQDPLDSLNARWSIEQIIAEPLEINGWSKEKRRARVEELLSIVGLDKAALDRFPHEFSGGQRQRIGIARALALSPKLILADEPVSALDVSIQAQILNLLKDLQDQFGLSFLFIAHDIHVIRFISHRIAVMYMGRIVELGSSEAIGSGPKHPYTRALMASVPEAQVGAQEFQPIEGEIPSLIDPPPGCPFHPRCALAQTECKAQVPELLQKAEGHWAACPIV